MEPSFSSPGRTIIDGSGYRWLELAPELFWLDGDYFSAQTLYAEGKEGTTLNTIEIAWGVKSVKPAH